MLRQARRESLCPQILNNEALAAFIAGGMPEECAKQAITMIAQRKIPHISINY